MNIPVSELDTPRIEKILQAWVSAGGKDPQMEAEKIHAEIQKAMQGDSGSRMLLADGYRCDNAKLVFRVIGDTVDVAMNHYLLSAKPEREEQKRTMNEHFQQLLRGIFSA